MEAGGMLPGRDPPARAEVVHESERTRVTRLFLAERAVIRKEPLGPDAERRLRHEAAILDRLRTVVTGRDGWFVAGKFDQYRRDLEFDAGYQAFRALGRLLLAEPEDELVRLREQILSAAGPNAGLLTAVVPEFAALLAVPPDPGDPLTAQARAQRASAAALRAVASRKRPVVLFLDDLQWAGRTPAGLVDIVLSEEPIEGLLLARAYRESDVDAAHPLAAPLSRWLGQAMVRQLRLVNLPAASFVTMVAEMLRVDRPAAAALAGMISPHTSGGGSRPSGPGRSATSAPPFSPSTPRFAKWPDVNGPGTGP